MKKFILSIVLFGICIASLFCTTMQTSVFAEVSSDIQDEFRRLGYSYNEAANDTLGSYNSTTKLSNNGERYSLRWKFYENKDVMLAPTGSADIYPSDHIYFKNTFGKDFFVSTNLFIAGKGATNKNNFYGIMLGTGDNCLVFGIEREKPNYDYISIQHFKKDSSAMYAEVDSSFSDNSAVPEKTRIPIAWSFLGYVDPLTYFYEDDCNAYYQLALCKQGNKCSLYVNKYFWFNEDDISSPVENSFTGAMSFVVDIDISSFGDCYTNTDGNTNVGFFVKNRPVNATHIVFRNYSVVTSSSKIESENAKWASSASDKGATTFVVYWHMPDGTVYFSNFAESEKIVAPSLEKYPNYVWNDVPEYVYGSQHIYCRKTTVVTPTQPTTASEKGYTASYDPGIDGNWSKWKRGMTSDNIFSFESGGALQKTGLSRFAYALNLKNADYLDLSRFGKVTYTFRLFFATDAQSTDFERIDYKIVIVDNVGYLMAKNVTLSTTRGEGGEQLSFPNLQLTDCTDTKFLESGYTLLGKFDAVNNNVSMFGSNSKTMFVDVIPSSKYCNYYMLFEYNFYEYKDVATGWFHWGWVHEKRYVPVFFEEGVVYDADKKPIDRILCSSVCGVNSILRKINEQGSLTDEFSGNVLSLAQRLLGEYDLKKIEVKYLTQIDCTPFAVSKRATVNVPVSSATVNVSDVCSALGINTFDCLGSSCMNFVKTDSGVYVAYYLSRTWLSSKTADGNNVNYFLNINFSYRDYYWEVSNEFVADNPDVAYGGLAVGSKAFSEDLYGYVLNCIHLKYPATKTVSDSNLHGLWGYVVVPQTYNWNMAIKELFDTTNTGGMLYHFDYSSELSKDAYNNLTTRYNYSWLQRCWKNIMNGLTSGSTNATHYVFYCDPTVDEAFIGENGADDAHDNNSATINGAQDIAEWIAANKSKLTTILSVVGSIVLLCFVGICVSKIIANVKNGSNRRRRK